MTAYFDFAILNVHLVRCDSNGGRMKVKFTIKYDLKKHHWCIMQLSKHY